MMKKLALCALMCFTPLLGERFKEVDAHMCFVDMYIDYFDEMPPKEYRSMRKIVKKIMKLSFYNRLVIYRYLELLVKNDMQFDPGS